MPTINGSGQDSPQMLDRPPTLPPDVQPSTFNSLAGQQDPSQGAGPSAGGMQIGTIVGQLGMQIEMLALKLGQLVPGTEGAVGTIQQLVRQIAVAGLTQSQGPPQQPGPQASMGALAGPEQPQGPSVLPMLSAGGG